MPEDKKAKQDRWPPVRRPASRWWLLAKSENYGAEVLLADCGGEQALPVFSGGGEAEMFVWLRGTFEDGWRVRETSAGELVSILYGLCAGVGRVALDPSPEMSPETIRLVSLSRERFVSWVVDSPFHPGNRHKARGLVRLL
jgi:hypothetical protein